MSSIKWRFMAWDYCKNRAVSCAVKQPEKNFLIDISQVQYALL